MVDNAEFVCIQWEKSATIMPLFVQLDFHNDEKKRQGIECSIIGAYVSSLDREIE